MGKFLNQYEIFFKKAKSDLAASEILYAKFIEGGDLDIDIIFFHLQQSAEKLIKTVLSKNKINFPRIHDLETLLKIAHDHKIDLHMDSGLLSELNDSAVEGRYSMIHDDIANIQNYFTILHKLLDTVVQKLNE
jgi:HEPN domain-containing protein